MKMIIAYLFTLTLFANELTFITSYLPPFVFKNANEGIEVEIVKKALELKGHKFNNFSVPFKRIGLMYNENNIDGALTMHSSVDSKIKTFYSDNHIHYKNVVISLKSKKLNIKQLKDLKDKSIATFQNSKEILGQEYKEIVKANSNYQEFAEQMSQVHLLYLGRIDVIILDHNIFRYLRSLASEYLNVNQDVEVVELFPKSYFQMGFKNKDIRDDFNAGLKVLKNSGEYAKIYKKYFDRYTNIHDNVNPQIQKNTLTHTK